MKTYTSNLKQSHNQTSLQTSAYIVPFFGYLKKENAKASFSFFLSPMSS